MPILPFKIFILTIIISYSILCVATYIGQRQLLYFPQVGVELADATPITFSSASLTLSGWIINPGQSRALLYYGGNAEQVEFNSEFFHTVLPNYTVYLVPYRGYGGNLGIPTEKALYQDALSIYDTLANQHDSFVVMGRSLGSGVATYVAAQRRVDKVILVTPYDSIESIADSRYWMFPVKYLLKDRFASIERISKINVPILILIAEHDRVIPYVHTENLIRAISPAILTTSLVAGANHNNISNQIAYSNAIDQFLLAE
jgi:hypothetical protein